MSIKKELRKDYKKILTNLDNRWIEAASHRIGKELSSLLKEELHHEIDHLLCFSTFFAGEVDLTNFISEQIKHKSVYLPLLHQDGKMTFISIDSNWQEVAATGAFGISEPLIDSGNPFLPEFSSRSAIIVPGVAFDKMGNRLGRGKGYYDRLLSNRKYRAMTKIGVCWEMQLLEEVPSESHDVSVDWICHEKGMIKTGATFDEDA